MSKQEELQKLFMKDKAFIPLDKDSVYWGQECIFNCVNSEINVCNVLDTEVKRTCSPGNETSKVLIIGEAPSRSKGKDTVNAKTSQLFKDTKGTSKSPQHLLKEFVRDEYPVIRYRSIPYFTDYIKCGVVKQDKKHRKILKGRQEPCFEKFLMKELEILKPEIILVCKKEPFYYLLTKLDEISKSIENFELMYIYHYSADKFIGKLKKKIKSNEDAGQMKKRIWKMQVECLMPEEFKDRIRYMKIIVEKGKPPIIFSDSKSQKKLKKMGIL